VSGQRCPRRLRAEMLVALRNGRSAVATTSSVDGVQLCAGTSHPLGFGHRGAGPIQPHPAPRQSAGNWRRRGQLLGARPRVFQPPGPPMRTPATIAPPTGSSEPRSPRIPGNPGLSPRFQALVPEMEREHRRFRQRPETTKPRMQGLRGDGARGTRTPDLLGAIQALCAQHRRRQTSISRHFRSEGGGHHERG
jgi:hypothetical protein